MEFLKRVYTIYALTVFVLLFFIFFTLLLIPIMFPKKHRLVGIFNRWWARSIFFLCGLPYSVKYESKLDPNKQYIFCPNHFSYLDIPAMGLNRHNTIFVGKNELENIPLFGFMYRKLHITVDRSKLKSRYSTLLKTLEALDQGKSLVIFPEGGIVMEKEPVMGSFKDGAFRAAIEKQIPIVPVTIPFNWIILPENRFLVTWHPLKVIFHEPVDPGQYTIQTMESMKMSVRNTIEQELERHLRYENRPQVIG